MSKYFTKEVITVVNIGILDKEIEEKFKKIKELEIRSIWAHDIGGNQILFKLDVIVTKNKINQIKAIHALLLKELESMLELKFKVAKADKIELRREAGRPWRGYVIVESIDPVKFKKPKW